MRIMFQHLHKQFFLCFFLFLSFLPSSLDLLLSLFLNQNQRASFIAIVLIEKMSQIQGHLFFFPLSFFLSLSLLHTILLFALYLLQNITSMPLFLSCLKIITKTPPRACSSLYFGLCKNISIFHSHFSLPLSFSSPLLKLFFIYFLKTFLCL